MSGSTRGTSRRSWRPCTTTSCGRTAGKAGTLPGTKVCGNTGRASGRASIRTSSRWASRPDPRARSRPRSARSCAVATASCWPTRSCSISFELKTDASSVSISAQSPAEAIMDSNEARHSAAHYFLEGLNEIGIDYLFCNFGTDHAPLIEAMAGFKRNGRKAPGTILCPHEVTAVHMAAGYAIATGRGQGVIVHVDAGTANAAMSLHNLCRGRVPVLLMAGRAPYTTRGELLGTRDNYVHFVQEPFDQASLVRPYTKWEYNLPSGVVAKEALRRAHTVMMSDPRGPVYLTFPRETLAELWSEGQIRSYPEERFGPASVGAVDAGSVDAIATRLLAAERPLLITAYVGRNHASVAALDELARFAGIRVSEFKPVHLNLAHDSPCDGRFLR